MITQAELDELKKLCDEATPGPWDIKHSYDSLTVFKGTYDLDDYSNWSEDIFLDEERDFPFINSARTALPKLIAALEDAYRKSEKTNATLCEHSWSTFDNVEGCLKCGALKVESDEPPVPVEVGRYYRMEGSDTKWKCVGFFEGVTPKWRSPKLADEKGAVNVVGGKFSPWEE